MAYKDIDGQMDLFANGFLDNLIAQYEEKEKSAPKKAPKPSNKASNSPKTATKVTQMNKQTAPKTKPENKAEPKGVVIQFPKPVPEVDVTITDGNATYEDCKRKFAEEQKKFVGANNDYVFTGLLELCKVDSNFRNRVMLENKSYAGFFDYMASQAQKGIGAYVIGQNRAIMDDDTALGIAIDYYNL